MKTKTIKSLVASILAIIVCATMLIGTTFAWFTDSVTSESNKIVSGTLKVDLELLQDDAWVSLKDSKQPIFNYDNWEPGYTDVKVLKVENEGSLALKWKAKFVSSTQLSILADVIDVYVLPSATELAYPVDRNLDGYTKVGTVKDFVNTIESTTRGELGAGECAYLGIALRMQNVGNQYQNLDLCGAFDIMILATQLTAEQDGFNDQYDSGAEYPTVADKWDGTASIAWYLEDPSAQTFSLSSAEDLAGLATLVDGTAAIPADATDISLPVLFDGKEIKLESSVDMSGAQWNPIGDNRTDSTFNGTFDGQNNVIKNIGIETSDNFNGAVYGSYEGWGLFSVTDGATIKNLTVDGALFNSYTVITGAIAGYANDTTFENITITNAQISTYNWYCGGVAGWTAGQTTFKGVTLDETNSIGTLWGSYDTPCGGISGGASSSAIILIEDCNVACVIDAVNDICSNYQWTAYRLAGMLIGNIKSTQEIDGTTYPNPTGIVTCINVTVTYGEWANYHYCESESYGKPSYAGEGEWKYNRVESSDYGTDGIDITQCNHDTDESHNELFVFDQLFGGDKGVYGLPSYDGVTIIYNNK